MRWTMRTTSAALAAELGHELGLYTIVAKVFVARGFDTLEKIRDFIDRSIDRSWSDPKDIPGMVEVADSLEHAVKGHKKICIFGDYDTDGMTAAAIMYNTLTFLGSRPEVVLPLREGEGYGLSEAALERVYAMQPDVLLTVDCGVSAVEAVSELVKRGIKVLITDHHEVSESIPQGIPLADPKLNPRSPAVILAGAGVALKLAALLSTRFKQDTLWKSQIGLAALGTIADCMPLIGENRALVFNGIKNIAEHPPLGVSAIFERSTIKMDALSSESLSFGLIPRLNASGRMSDPMISFDLLTTQSQEEADRLARKLENLNKERKLLEASLYAQALEQLEPLSKDQRVIVVGGKGWHQGVRGIVASKLSREYGVPALVFSLNEGLAVGSGRSVGTIDLYAAVSKLSDLLVRFGGHPLAIGATLNEADLKEFTLRLNAELEKLPNEAFDIVEKIDCTVSLAQLSFESVEELDIFEPHGNDNPHPVFLTHDLMIKNARFVGEEKNHLSFKVSDGTKELLAIWFNVPYKKLDDVPTVTDLVYRVQIDTWRGRSTLKLFVLDMLFSKTKEPAFLNADCSLNKDSNNLELLSTDKTINETLAYRMIGAEVTLRAAQVKCLETLQEGKSTLAIMATGRGKSLIFHLHAAKIALLRKESSLFIYPLRSLINDQLYSLSQALSTLGIRCASLTGASEQNERTETEKALEQQTTHIVLATPEYVLANRHAGAFWSKFSFVVVDEAHHIATSSTSFRPGYTQLEQLRQMAPQATFLALSATSDKPTTDSIVSSLGVENIVVDTSKRLNLRFVDKRNSQDRYKETATIIAESTKALIYVSSRPGALELCKSLRKDLRDKAHHIAFYHAALTTQDRRKVEAAFRSGELTCLVATSAFGEGVNIPDIRDVILYDLPYSIIDFNQMSGRAGRDGKEASIFLMAQKSDLDSMMQGFAQKNNAVASCDATALEEQETAAKQLEAFANWLFMTSAHGLSSVIQKPLTPLEELELRD